MAAEAPSPEPELPPRRRGAKPRTRIATQAPRIFSSPNASTGASAAATGARRNLGRGPTGVIADPTLRLDWMWASATTAATTCRISDHYTRWTLIALEISGVHNRVAGLVPRSRFEKDPHWHRSRRPPVAAAIGK